MKTASQVLLQEHQAILVALKVIDKIRVRLQENAEMDFKDLLRELFVGTCLFIKQYI